MKYTKMSDLYDVDDYIILKRIMIIVKGSINKRILFDELNRRLGNDVNLSKILKKFEYLGLLKYDKENNIISLND